MKKITKNTKAILFAIVLLFASSNIFAMEVKPTVKVLNAKNKTFALVINDVKSATVSFKIVDTEGVTLFDEKVKVSKMITKSYNLSKLPAGIYELEIEDDFSFRKQIIKISFDKLEILETEERKISKPYISKKDKSILLNTLVLNKANVEVEIFDDAGVLIFSEKFENTLTVHRQYNFEKYPTGFFTIKVATMDKVFLEKFSL